MDEKMAFMVMTVFLEEYWNRVGRPDALGDLLSGLQWGADGLPADPAHWFDWLRALDAVKSERR